MPHIHTEPNQHDMTVSAYVIMANPGSEPTVLVHMHRKFGKLLQIGGHIELDETPWQAIAHEIAEESGYSLTELSVLQPTAQPASADGAILHPVPVLMNTHTISHDHFHSDLCYAFVASAPPQQAIALGESDDLRWLTLEALKHEVQTGGAAKDVAHFYEVIMSTYLNVYNQIPADSYSLAKPTLSSM